MAIPVGTKLDTYEVTRHIGSGGMGEVYQAHDSKLGRDVAIKVLPEQFARDPERLARFQREAKMLAALNHPNIAAIYGLEQSGDTHYLVLELVPGDTLAQRIRVGAIPLDEALPIARQVADAVEYAHDKNVIHRDLKPANIKVTVDGTVKVLDFGLAKAMSEDPTEGDMSNSPTLSMAATRQGVILGTAAYMSPEQAKGRQVDRRTDVWAFGAVFYEMLTGKQAFSGEDITEVLAAVVKSEPAFDALPANTPPAIRTLLRRCLDKNIKRRLTHVGEARILLEDVLSGAASAEAATRASHKGRERIAWATGPALTLVALAILSFWYFRKPLPVAPPETRTDIVTPPTSDPISLALSPDGRQLVFAASEDGPTRLWVRRLDETISHPLAGTNGASLPFWSPDGRSLGFFADGKLKRLDLAGGSPETLTDSSGRGGTWGPDGTIVFGNVFGPLMKISASGGQTVAASRLDSQTSQRFPYFLPGSRRFLFYALGGSQSFGICLGSLDSPEIKRLTAAETNGVLLPSGWLMFIRDGRLLAQRLDLAHEQMAGDPVTVADPVRSDVNLSVGAFSASDNGFIAFRSGQAGQRQLAWFDRSGKMIGTLGAPDANGLNAPNLSPDGHRAAMYHSVQGNADIWLVDATRSTRFTFDPARDLYPVWSPDGTRIVFDSNRKGHRDLYVKSTNGSGAEEPLLASPEDKSATDWSRDGRFVLYQTLDDQAKRHIWLLPMEGDRKPSVFLKTNFDEARAKFSPDEHWISYMSNESGQFEIYVRPFDATHPGANPAGQWQVSARGGVNPRWRADGKELYYMAPDGKLMAVPVSANGNTFQRSSPVALFRPLVYGGGTDSNAGGTQYDVSADGRFLVNTFVEEAASPITLLQNWNPEAKK